MKTYLPSRQTMLLCACGVVLGLWSLPDLPNFKQHTHHHSRRMQAAVATTAQPLPPGPVPPVPGAPGTPGVTPQAPTAPGAKPKSPIVPEQVTSTAPLRIRVIDGRTLKPLAGAEVVLIETEQRFTTNQDGYTKFFEAPIVRNPRYRPLVAELHGQLGVVVYKNGYRDSVHLGIRMHEGRKAEATVWMYRLGPGDTRIEPVLYQVPYHHLWLVELADRFRSKTQPGEGPQRP